MVLTLTIRVPCAAAGRREVEGVLRGHQSRRGASASTPPVVEDDDDDDEGLGHQGICPPRKWGLRKQAHLTHIRTQDVISFRFRHHCPVTSIVHRSVHAECLALELFQTFVKTSIGVYTHIMRHDRYPRRRLDRVNTADGVWTIACIALHV